jgi:hypothetical protein
MVPNFVSKSFGLVLRPPLGDLSAIAPGILRHSIFNQAELDSIRMKPQEMASRTSNGCFPRAAEINIALSTFLLLPQLDNNAVLGYLEQWAPQFQSVFAH